MEGGNEKKKIRTESGRYINASYKKDLYREWIEKNKLEKLVDWEEDHTGAPRESPPPQPRV